MLGCTPWKWSSDWGEWPTSGSVQTWSQRMWTQKASTSFGQSHWWVWKWRCSSASSPEGWLSFSSRIIIDISVQKGGIPGAPSCPEHSGVVTQLIREAHAKSGDLAVLWLDLYNTRSIPCKVVELTLRHHVPSKINKDETSWERKNNRYYYLHHPFCNSNEHDGKGC